MWEILPGNTRFLNALPLTPLAEPDPALFDADFMRKLETLHLLARKLFRR